MNQDPYRILGVRRDAMPQEIRAAYLSLARKHHPDINRSDAAAAEERFKAINAAYELLSDSLTRSAYDRAWEAKNTYRPPNPPPSDPPPSQSRPNHPPSPPGSEAAPEPPEPVKRAWYVTFLGVALVVAVCGGGTWLVERGDDGPNPQSVSGSSLSRATSTPRRSATSTPSTRSAATATQTPFIRRTTIASNASTSDPCEGWNQWVSEVEVLRAEYDWAYSQMQTVTYPTVTQYGNWAVAVADHAADMRLVTPPPAGRNFHESEIDMLALIAEQLRAYSDGLYTYSDSLGSRIDMLDTEVNRLLDQANSTCATDYDAAAPTRTPTPRPTVTPRATGTVRPTSTRQDPSSPVQCAGWDTWLVQMETIGTGHARLYEQMREEANPSADRYYVWADMVEVELRDMRTVVPPSAAKAYLGTRMQLLEMRLKQFQLYADQRWEEGDLLSAEISRLSGESSRLFVEASRTCAQ